MKFTAQDFLKSALPALNFATSSAHNFITDTALIEPKTSTSVSVTCSTGEGYIRCEAPVTVPPAKPFCVVASDFVRLLKASSGNAEMSGGQYKCGSFAAKLPLIPAKDFPSVAPFAEELTLTLYASSLRQILTALMPIAKEKDFSVYNGLLFISGRAAVLNADGQNMGAFIDGTWTLENPFRIPNFAFRHILSALADVDANEDIHICVSEQGRITMAIGSTEMSISGYSDKTTDWLTSLLNKVEAGQMSTLSFNAKEMQGAVSRATIFNPDHLIVTVDGEQLSVKSHSYKDDKVCEDSAPLLSSKLTDGSKGKYTFAAKNFSTLVSSLAEDVKCQILDRGMGIFSDGAITIFIQQISLPEV